MGSAIPMGVGQLLRLDIRFRRHTVKLSVEREYQSRVEEGNFVIAIISWVTN